MKRFFLPAVLAISISACATGGGSSGTTSREEAATAIANADTGSPTSQVTYEKPAVDSKFSIFAPNPSASRAGVTLDYSVWSELLDAMVIYMGPSLRARSSRPDPAVGTRLVTGHDSPFRLEGNKVYFSGLDREFVPILTEYREDLERIANEANLTTLNRNEQLAFWLNFYNVITIEQIALQYPVKYPSEMRIGDNRTVFDEAKLVTVNNVPLSLKDIRENIVYANWNDTRVIYGFFRGDLGGPTIQGTPFTRTNVSLQLDRNAREYVNSLRGVYKTGNTMKVSRLYEEVRPFYFQNWPRSIKDHLLIFMDDEVINEFTFAEAVDFQVYETRVADLAGGDLRTPKSNVQNPAGGTLQNFFLPESAIRMLRELDVKVQTLKQRGAFGRRGRVIILDDNVVLPGQEEDDIE